MKTNENFERELLQLVGGSENVISATHCMTRLRLRLKDENKAKTDDIKKMKGVINVLISNGQYQIVIGTHVTEVYSVFDTLLKESKGGEEKQSNSSEEEVQKNKNIFAILLDVISSVFTPTLGLLAGSGIIKGLASLLAVTNVIQKTDGAFILLQNIGNTFFYFFPVVLGYTAAKKFKLTPLMGIVIGACLVNPAFINILSNSEPLYTLFDGSVIASPVYFSLLGIPVLLMNYSQTVIPIIFAVFLAAKLEKKLKVIVPKVLQMFAVPMLTLLITMVITFLFVGPVITWISSLISVFIKASYDLNPIVAGILLGGLWQVFVMFGVHWGLTPIGLNNFSIFGFDPIMCLMYGTPFATAGSVLGVLVKTKDPELKALSLPAALMCFIGVTEPAIYGITLPRKRPFIAGLVGGAIGGGILGAFGSKIYTPLAGGIFAIPNFIAETGIDAGFYGAIIAVTIAFLTAFIGTVIFYKEEIQ